METLLLQTKLYMPQPGPDLVHRPQLQARFNEGLQRPLTLVSAPAGFGKTTAVSHWLLAVGAKPEETTKSAWLSLDSADNDPIRFLDYFLAAFGQADPDLEATLHPLRQIAQQAGLEDTIPALLNVLAANQTSTILVLDDYHLIQNQVIHNALILLLDHLPPHHRLVITSRADPPFPLARFRVRRQVTEIRTDDLRFSSEEATYFLRQMMGLDLSSQDVAALEKRTEGWIAGLQMAALSMQGRSDLDNFIEDFTGSHRFIFDYLAEEVLAQRPKGTRDFLLQTAVLDRLCAPLCDAVLDSQDSQQILAQLEAANFFLIPLDDTRGWYRYHHLFADLLRQSLRRELPKQETLLLRQASDWFEQAGYIDEAIEYALKARDFNRAASLIEPIAQEMAYRMDIDTLERWIEALPEVLLIQHPGIVYPYAVTLSVTNRFDTLIRYLEKTEKAAQDNIDKPGAPIVLGQVAFQQCINHHIFGEYEQALKAVPQTQMLLRQYEQPADRWELEAIMGYATIHAVGDRDAAMYHLDNARQAGSRNEGPIGVTLSHTFAANAHLLLGHLHQAHTLLHTATEAAQAPDGTLLPHAPFPAALLARLHYEWNNIPMADQYVDTYLPLPTVTGFTMDPVDTIYVQIMLALAKGERQTAQAAIEQAQRHWYSLPVSPAFQQRLAAIQALLWLRLGQIATAAQWADTVHLPTAAEQIKPFHVFPYLVWARIRIAQGIFDGLNSFLERLYTWAKQQQLHSIVIESGLVQALSTYAQNQVDTALDHLNDALILATPEGYIRLFVDEGKPMQQLLRQAAKKKIQVDYISTLLTAFEAPIQTQTTTLPNTETVSPAPQQSLIEPLTQRERELLTLLAEGLTNQEIATRLVIAVSTVKRHTINIYGKLSVRNRTEAVKKAQELNLLY